jgi:hypothetical protein
MLDHLPTLLKILIGILMAAIYILGMVFALVAVIIFKAWEWRDRAGKYDPYASMKYDR